MTVTSRHNLSITETNPTVLIPNDCIKRVDKTKSLGIIAERASAK